MFDSVGAFSRQFTPVDGGYLFYPSRTDGGKLVTSEEFEALVFEWQRVAGRSGTWKSVGLVALVLLIWTFFSRELALPAWTNWIIIIAAIAGLSGRFLWASFAPRRLVRKRPRVAPPRPLAPGRSKARGALSWPLVILVLLMNFAMLADQLGSPDSSLNWWASTIGSGLMIGWLLWIATQKLRNR